MIIFHLLHLHRISSDRASTHFIFILIEQRKMRTRITYIQPPGSQYDKKRASLTKKALSVKGLDASRQEKVTLGLDEVPGLVCILSLFSFNCEEADGRNGLYFQQKEIKHMLIK